MNPGNTWVKTRAVNELSWLWNRKAQGKINRSRQENLDFPDAKIRLDEVGQERTPAPLMCSTRPSTDQMLTQEPIIWPAKTITTSKNAWPTTKKDLPTLAMPIIKVTLTNSRPPRFSPQRSGRDALIQEHPKRTLSSSVTAPLFSINDNQLRTNKAFRQFISCDLKNISGLVSKSNYIPLPDATYRLLESKK